MYSGTTPSTKESNTIRCSTPEMLTESVTDMGSDIIEARRRLSWLVLPMTERQVLLHFAPRQLQRAV